MYRAEQKIPHLPAVPETHLVLGWMHIDVHLRRRHLQVEGVHWLPALIQDILIGLTDRIAHQTITDHAAVDIEILEIRLAARKSR